MKVSRIENNSSFLGHEDTLRCESDGNPPPEYTWLDANTGETLHLGQQLTFDVCRHLSQCDNNETINLQCVAKVSGFYGTHSDNVTATFFLYPRLCTHACGMTTSLLMSLSPKSTKFELL